MKMIKLKPINKSRSIFLLLALMIFLVFAQSYKPQSKEVSAKDILGNPMYKAFSYGGYRGKSRINVPTVKELEEDMKILAAMGVKLLRTYNTQQYAHTDNLLQAIRNIKNEDPNFEMYLMLGTWIECEGAWTAKANHTKGNTENNTAEIETAIAMAKKNPDIVKIIAVGNEAMVTWAANYFVTPNVILEWVEHLQGLKKEGKLPKDLWITSSDNYESWGGGAASYRTDDLAALIGAVDFVSLHTYPFHDSHYNPSFWAVPEEGDGLLDLEKIEMAMVRAKNYAKSQYKGALDYMKSLGLEKPIHMGETGWATIASTSYGATGSHAADEYKEKLYYEAIREWTDGAGMTCFYFEAFDEQWKDLVDHNGSENHFGLINLQGQAKYALWDMIDNGIFKGLTRNGQTITKTYGGDESKLLSELMPPKPLSEIGLQQTIHTNVNRNAGDGVTEGTYLVLKEDMEPNLDNDTTYPSAPLKLNVWEGTCEMFLSPESELTINTGTGEWWGGALEIQSNGENLSNYSNGHLFFDIKGHTSSNFQVGFQTGVFSKGDQENNGAIIGPGLTYVLTEDWKTISIPISELNRKGNLSNVTALLYLLGEDNFDGKTISLKNIFFTKD
ncbi:MAG: exo-beta-1,3-glucanase (GH17 family) [Sediminicola sp.]|jgi:exo-beta-1,3-glucanase (GH17 family)